MGTTHNSPVVVGVDGSEEALTAVEWAAGQAQRIQRPLRVVHAFEWPEFHVRLGPPAGAPPWTGLANAARQIVSEAKERAREAAPGIQVDGEYVEGFRRPVLLAETRDAALIVVGSRGLGGVGSLLIGSSGVELAARAACPVAVVPAQTSPRSGTDIVAAVDCSPASSTVLDFALAEARRRGAEVRALLVWQGAGLRRGAGREESPADQEDSEQEARRRLGDFVRSRGERPPEVAVREQVVPGNARQVLADVSGEAALLVVGSRGYGAFKGLVMGSVSQSVLHHAQCPVVVVPAA